MSFLYSKPSIFNKWNINKFIRLFAKDDNWHNFDIERHSLGYGLIHYSLIRNLSATKILCIGSRYGFIPAVCALACRDNNEGRVDFVDAGYDSDFDENHWGGVGLWKKISSNKYFGKFGLEKFIDLHVMLSKEFLLKMQKKTKWDYIHIDGDHSYKGVSSDFKMFWPLLKKGGFLALHDIYTKDLGGLDYGVNKFWNELRDKKKYNMFEFPGECGLGLIQKQNNAKN